jgi:hypothetical protein
MDRPKESESHDRNTTLKRFLWTKRRIIWTVGVAIGGLFIGGKGGGIWGTALGIIWGGGIGYGFGSVLDIEHPTKTALASWAATFALTGLFFGLLVGAGTQNNPSAGRQTAMGAIGAATGSLVGLLVGAVHLRRLRRRSHAPNSDFVA